jgi:flagellar biosynthetic protein FliQ
MTESYVLDIFRQSIYLILIVSAPMLIVSIVVGLLIAIFQATTQIQEQTLAFVPKIIAIFLSMILFGSWIMRTMIEFTLEIINNIDKLSL